ncbi:ion channel regulatory protein UNC-93 domain-containing protein [Ditylenchus destructor]|nr:ion channel regulatory protein UNC-93 domain-containing protein [Ditylenchus destructor]
MDSNAWELVEEAPKEREKRSSTTPSSIKSKRASASTFGIEVEEGTTFDGETTSTKDDGRRDRKKNNQNRSKSPAVESIRKVSRAFLQKVGIKPRKKDDEQVTITLLQRTADILDLRLDDYCRRPIQFSPDEEEKDKAGLLPKILSPSLLLKRRDLKERCSYLFRSTDDTHHADVLLASKSLQRVPHYDQYCPVHGSKRRLRRNRLVDMHSFVTSVDTADNEELSPILNSQAYLAKMLRKRRRAYLSGNEKIHVGKAKHKILANLWIISIAFLFLFTGFNGIQNLQTSVNSGMGADALCILYLSLAISSFFVPSFVINRLGCKMTLVAAIGVHILYMFANFIPRYYSLIPASIFVGVAASSLWAAAEEYITESGIKYAKLNVEAQNIVIVRFFGYFFMILHLGQVVGNLLSSVILINSVPSLLPIDKVDPTCGHKFVSNISALSERAQFNLQRPAQFAYLSVVGVHLCCITVALLVVLLFLNALRRDEIRMTKAPKFTAEVLRQTLKHLRKPKPLLLIPLTVFSGVEQAFAVGLYTKAYVACGLGIPQIGYVMASFGIADAICSLVFGPLIKLFGRMPLFVFGAVINMLMIFTLMIWPLNPGDRALFNAVAGVWGMADGVWNTQLNGFWVALLGRGSLEVAFANYRFWMSSGLALGFFLMRVLSVDGYLLVAFVFLLIGILGYFIVELYDMFIEYVENTCIKSPEMAEEFDELDVEETYINTTQEMIPEVK